MLQDSGYVFCQNADESWNLVAVPSSSFVAKNSHDSCSTVNLHIFVSNFIEDILKVLG